MRGRHRPPCPRRLRGDDAARTSPRVAGWPRTGPAVRATGRRRHAGRTGPARGRTVSRRCLEPPRAGIAEESRLAVPRAASLGAGRWRRHPWDQLRVGSHIERMTRFAVPRCAEAHGRVQKGTDLNGAAVQSPGSAPRSDHLRASGRDDTKRLVVGGANGVTRGPKVARVGVAKGEEIHDDQPGMPAGPRPGGAALQGGTVTPVGVAGCRVEEYPDCGGCEVGVSPPTPERVPKPHVS